MLRPLKKKGKGWGTILSGLFGVRETPTGGKKSENQIFAFHFERFTKKRKNFFFKGSGFSIFFLSFFPLAVANVKQRKTKNLIFHFLEVSKSKFIFKVFSCSKSFFLLLNDVMKLWGRTLLTLVSICLN